MNPKFSIAIPAHNRPDYLGQAIDWALKQTVPDWELVVSDDCSTEDLDCVVKAVGDSRVRIHRSEERLGATKNHQRAVQLSVGKYVITLNSDDLLLPNCLEIAGKCLDENPETGAVCFSTTYLIDSRVEGFQSMPRIRNADAKALAENSWLEKFHGTTPSCFLFRRDAFDRIGGYRTFLRFAYDWDLYMRMMRLGGGVNFLPEILGVYRRHDEQMVNQHSIDALIDILDLWVYPEYHHWLRSDVAHLLITEFRNLQLRGQPTTPILNEIISRKIFWKITRGFPRAISDRVISRLLPSSMKGDDNYVTPGNLEEAIATASRLLHKKS